MVLERTIDGSSSVTMNPPLSPNTCRALVPCSSYFLDAIKESHAEPNMGATFGIVNCIFCGDHFTNEQISRHITRHLLINLVCAGKLKYFKCCLECLASATPDLLKWHFRTHEKLNEADRFCVLKNQSICVICEVSFSNSLKFAIHLYEKHVSRDTPYVCPICYAYRSSNYANLSQHFAEVHRGTNEVFCPYCLKYFALPSHDAHPYSKTYFSISNLYEHIKCHWDSETLRCDSCRLEFLNRKESKLHEYLHHSGHPLIESSVDKSSCVDEETQNIQEPNLQEITYPTPRLQLNCIECGEIVRQPVGRHFASITKCKYCHFTTCCTLAFECHTYANHPDFYRIEFNVPESVPVVPTNSVLCSSETCGGSNNWIKRCKLKHAPPGIEYAGVLVCTCGYRTVLGNQMARHLTEHSSGVVILDRDNRPSIFDISYTRQNSAIKTSRWWKRRLLRSPIPLSTVGLARVV